MSAVEGVGASVLLVARLVVAPLEEIVFRGFLMTEIARIVGTSP